MPPDVPSLVKVERLQFAYPCGTPALVDVSFEIAAGERVGLIGPNGAGKSTLLWHLNGLLPERPRRGVDPAGAGQGGSAVTIDGLAVRPEHLPEIRRRVGLLFQDPDDQLFCPHVGEDVAFGPANLGLPRSEIETRVADALAAVGLQGYEERVPHHLSLGERKRVCLAGVLACRPRVLALDEPSANLDPRARRQLIGILHGLDCGQLIAGHDLEMILDLCPRVIVLDGGRVCADGPTREVLSDTARMEAHGLETPPSLAR